MVVSERIGIQPTLARSIAQGIVRCSRVNFCPPRGEGKRGSDQEFKPNVRKKLDTTS
jgi:hypothetical protein